MVDKYGRSISYGLAPPLDVFGAGTLAVLKRRAENELPSVKTVTTAGISS